MQIVMFHWAFFRFKIHWYFPVWKWKKKLIVSAQQQRKLNINTELIARGAAYEDDQYCWHTCRVNLTHLRLDFVPIRSRFPPRLRARFRIRARLIAPRRAGSYLVASTLLIAGESAVKLSASFGHSFLSFFHPITFQSPDLPSVINIFY